MKKYHFLDNKKFLIKLEKPRLLHILSNNKFHYKVNSINTQNKYNRNTSLSPLVIDRNNKISNNTNIPSNIINHKTYNSPNKTYNNIKDKTNNIMKTTPFKY